MAVAYQPLGSRVSSWVPKRFVPLNKLIIICGILFTFILVLLPFVNETAHDSVIDGASSVSSLVQWGSATPWTGKNASDGALRSYGKKDNFRENLRPDMNYIMSGFHSGWTNDVMMGANLIHLGLLTNRTPILFPFPPARHLRYIDDAAHIPPSLPFETVFDLPRLSHTIGIPLVRISELKARVPGKLLVGQEEDTIQPVEEEIGGWSIWMVTNPEWHKPKTSDQEEEQNKEIEDGRRCYQLDTYKIKPYFTPVPVTFRPVIDWTSVHFAALASLFKPLPNPFTQFYLTQVPSYFTERHREQPKLAPDDHVLYIDFLYNLGEAEGDSRYDWTGRGKLGKVGAWETVGKYMRWEPEIEEMTKGYLRRAFGVKDKKGARIPPFISVHIRRSDIGDICKDLSSEELAGTTDKNCYAPIQKYADRVAEVQKLLLEEKGIKTAHVLATTDEHDESFLKEVRDLGWIMLNHDKELTIEKNGLWYPTLIDSIALSLGTGFVGTSGSTMSILARRRVEEWNGGIGRQVLRKYGGLDDEN
ncbi:hypothetical protein [Phaffia rhodozyma]|uniref:O-fucosyltransferase family protein n=1 Tax=Phaffia rhodozyma TaxID=264483 RepID=A0A0F7ST57_PHARH|nr:hypothetical protein [Phaffia rhodozyma]